MENNKKPNYARPQILKSCQSDSNRKTLDLQPNKPWPKNSRRREQTSTSRNDQVRNSKQQYSSGKARPNVVVKRPRPRGFGYDNQNELCCGMFNDAPAAGSGLAESQAASTANENDNFEWELNSVYAQGNKKQNLNHLLNFHFVPRQSDFLESHGGGARANGGGGSKKHKYNKEQFLQANFQFVIRSNAKRLLNASPDTLMDWDLIEQIIIQTTEEPQCPICLYPPVAAKLTRCGHVYCWPCILHYLSLTDKSWRKCPICYESVHKADLKSTTIIQQSPMNIGDFITFNLMRRKKGSMFIERHASPVPMSERVPYLSSSNELKLFSKFLIARRADVADIIKRERNELVENEDPTCPEYVFIQCALNELLEKEKALGDFTKKEDECYHDDEIEKDKDLQTVEEIILDVIDGEPPADKEKPMNMATEPQANNVSIGDGVIATQTNTSNSKYYYFYQSNDGQNIYLHPLNVKMLLAGYGTLDRGPAVINARIIQKEHHSMDEEHRRKFTCLGHLPLTCQFAVVEVDLQPPTITEKILQMFKDDIMHRKKERKRREREERKREQKIDEINDRRIGKLIASTVNLNLNSTHEFPICGFEEALTESIDISPTTLSRCPATYSAVAVVGKSPTKEEFWPKLASSSGSSNTYEELSTWGKNHINVSSAVGGRRSAAPDRTSECESLSDGVGKDGDGATHKLSTSLGDVLAEAISQRKQRATNESASSGGAVGNVGGCKKKTKKVKMLPLFSTGMNFNGN